MMESSGEKRGNKGREEIEQYFSSSLLKIRKEYFIA
jgi:hypothetical protein